MPPNHVMKISVFSYQGSVLFICLNNLCTVFISVGRILSPPSSILILFMFPYVSCVLLCVAVHACMCKCVYVCDAVCVQYTAYRCVWTCN